MHFLFSLLGSAVACALIGASFVYVFAPAEVQRFLKTVGTAAALAFFILLAVWDVARALGPFTSMVAVVAISPVAYLVRAHRQHRSERAANLHGAERTPILPRRFPGDRA